MRYRGRCIVCGWSAGFVLRSSFLGLSALLSACEVGPDFKVPLSPEISTFTADRLQASNSADGKAQRFAVGRDLPAEYWRLFHSPALNSLVARALKDNPNIDAARAAIRVAQANTYAQVGIMFPQISGDYLGQGGKVATTPSGAEGGVAAPVVGPGGSNPSYYSLHTAQLAVSFVPDVWGGNMRQIENLEAVRDNQRFMNEATFLTLTSNIALGAIQEASLRAQIDVTERLIVTSREILDKIRLQKDQGQLTGLDVASQEALVAQTEAALPPLRKALAVQRDALTVLSGHLPGEGLPERFEFSRLKLPLILPVSLPSRLVAQRPDVRAAEENMRAASALIGAAIADRLPQFSLTGNIGRSGTFSNLFSNNPAFYFYTGLANASQVVFDGFTLQQKQRAAEAGFDQAAAQYRLAVLTAFQDVADSLYGIKHDTIGLDKALLAQTATEKALQLTRLQLSGGLIPITQVLAAQTNYLQAELTVVQAQTNRLSDTVALFQSLGGGWWNREAPVPISEPKAWLTSVTGLEPDPNATAYPGATQHNAR
jgi:NodT family efflux transporter outer membrane factor (OMF) lipoprotein